MEAKNPSGKEHHKKVPLVPVDFKKTGTSSNPPKTGPDVMPSKTTPMTPVPAVPASKKGWKEG
jgi:hypothetical protein